MTKLLIATRQSPLALVQANSVASRLKAVLAADCTLAPVISTGDRQTEWSLEARGGKGLFTAELESLLLLGGADIAVHSAKDLPGDMPPGLAIAGYLPRADPRDLLACRTGVTTPGLIATGSPRRRAQLRAIMPSATFTEIRGNVDSRLRKIASGLADATVLAAAGLARLDIISWDGLEFRPFGIDEIVPAVGQGAIAVQCRIEDVSKFTPALDAETGRAVGVERAIQGMLGAGCHTALGAHVSGNRLYFFHEEKGFKRAVLTGEDFVRPRETACRLLGEWNLV